MIPMLPSPVWRWLSSHTGMPTLRMPNEMLEMDVTSARPRSSRLRKK